MDNKKIPTHIGIAIIIIIAVTVGMFVWRYEKLNISRLPSNSITKANNLSRQSDISNSTRSTTGLNDLSDGQQSKNKQHKEVDLGDGNSTIEDSECLTPDFSPVTFGLRRIIYTVVPNDNLWNILSYDLSNQALVRKLKTEELNIVLDKIKDEMKNMTLEELMAIGIQSGDAGRLTTGDQVNLSPLLLDVKKVFDSTGVNLLKFQTSSEYKKNSKYVCWDEMLVFGADPESFVAFDNGYAADKNSFYSTWEKYEGANINTLIFFNGSYFKDNKSVFYDNVKMDGADVSTFEIIRKSSESNYGSSYARDKNYVYYMGERIEGQSPKEAYVIDDHQMYLRWGSSIYYADTIIDGVDLETFTPLEIGFANNTYSKDKSHVYYLNEIVWGADPETFNVVDQSQQKSFEAQDKNHKYKNGQAI